MKKINFNYEKFSQGWSNLDIKVKAAVVNYRGGDGYISQDELKLIHDITRNEREERGLISSVLLNRLGFAEFDNLGSYFGGLDDVYAIRQKIGDDYRTEKAKRNQINPFSWNFQKANEFKFEQIGDTQGVIDTLVSSDLKKIRENPELSEWIFMKMDIAPKDQEKGLETLIRSHYISTYQKSFTPENQAKVAENSQIKPIYEFFGSGIKHQNSTNFTDNIEYVMRDENLKYTNLIIQEQQNMDELKDLNLNIDDIETENKVQGAMNLNSPREEPVVIEKVKPAVDEPKIDYDKIFERAGIDTKPFKNRDEKIAENNLKSVISEHNFNRLCDEFSKTNANENDKKAVEKLRDSVYPKKAEYTIQRGENLSYIARKFNTSVDNLLRENPQIRDKNLIYAGQKLNLPTGIEVYIKKPTMQPIHQEPNNIENKTIDEPKKETTKQTRKLTSQEKEKLLKEFVEKKSSKSYRSSINRLYGKDGDEINRELLMAGKYNIQGLNDYLKQLDEMEKEVIEKVENIDVMGF